MKDFKKLKISLEGQLLGRGWHRALTAMNIASKYHTGKRKDDSPEFQHQVEQALLIISISDMLQDAEEFVVLAFLHDVMEDYDVTIDDVATGKDFGFGMDTAMRVYGISKVYRGVKRAEEEVWIGMENCPYISINKLIDRIHNQGTMMGGFKMPKIPLYLEETETKLLPMAKKARKRFPHQARAYYLLETILHRDIDIIRGLTKRLEEVHEVEMISMQGMMQGR